MQLIKLKRTVDSNTELFKSVLFIYCYVNDIKLSASELTTLAYFIQYGLKDDTIELVLRSKILKEDSLKNTLSKFRKYKFIKRVNKTDHLDDKFVLLAQKELVILLKLTNEKY